MSEDRDIGSLDIPTGDVSDQWLRQRSRKPDEVNEEISCYNFFMSKTILYIDGTNLFAGQNELFGPKRLKVVAIKSPV